MLAAPGPARVRQGATRTLAEHQQRGTSARPRPLVALSGRLQIAALCGARPLPAVVSTTTALHSNSPDARCCCRLNDELTAATGRPLLCVVPHVLARYALGLVAHRRHSKPTPRPCPLKICTPAYGGLHQSAAPRRARPQYPSSHDTPATSDASRAPVLICSHAMGHSNLKQSWLRAPGQTTASAQQHVANI